MSITSNDIHNQSFSIDRKGYDVDEVDVFLEHVADEIDQLNDTIARLQNQLYDAQETSAVAPVVMQAAAVEAVGTSHLDVQIADQASRINDLERQLADKRADDNAVAQALIIAQRTADEGHCSGQRDHRRCSRGGSAHHRSRKCGPPERHRFHSPPAGRP